MLVVSQVSSGGRAAKAEIVYGRLVQVLHGVAFPVQSGETIVRKDYM